MSLRVLQPGLASSAQDLGLRGRAHLGVSRGGAADMRSLSLANLALGNARGAMGLELVLEGPLLQAEAPCVMAWCGAPFVVEVDGAPVPALEPTPLAAGARLRVGRCALGLRAALAFQGGVALPRSARLQRDMRVSLGGGGGVPRVPPLVPLLVPPLAEPTAALLSRAGEGAEILLRVTGSCHSERFPAEARAALLSAPFVVQAGSDRRGVRLRGPPLPLPPGPEPLTVGVSLGALQVTPAGEAILLGVDQTTTGGYALLAQLIAADAWWLGQLRPGTAVRFLEVGLEQARAIYQAEATWR